MTYSPFFSSFSCCCAILLSFLSHCSWSRATTVNAFTSSVVPPLSTMSLLAQHQHGTAFLLPSSSLQQKSHPSLQIMSKRKLSNSNINDDDDDDDDGWNDTPKSDEILKKQKELNSLLSSKSTTATTTTSSSSSVNQNRQQQQQQEEERDLFIPIFSLVSLAGLFGAYGYEMIRLYLRGELYLPWDN